MLGVVAHTFNSRRKIGGVFELQDSLVYIIEKPCLKKTKQKFNGILEYMRTCLKSKDRESLF